MKNKHFIAVPIAVLLLLCWTFTGCISWIDTRKMNMAVENKSGQILNLKYAGDAEEKLKGMAESMVRNGFLNTQGEEYGYYDIRYEITTRDFTPLTAYMVAVPILIPLYLFGVPTAGSNFTIVAQFYIFDANGNIVKHYSNTKTYNQSVNLYMNGSGVSKRGAREFTTLFNVIFNEAASQSEEINRALRNAGTVASNSSITEVQANIDRFFRENPYAQSR